MLSNSSMKPFTLRTLKPIAQVLFLLGVIFFAGSALSAQWSEIENISISWQALIIPQGLFMLGLGLLPLGPYFILRGLNYPLSMRQTWHIFFVSNMAKYLPGGIWALPGRGIFYTRQGIPAKPATAAVIWEVLLMILSAGIVSLLSLPTLSQFIPWQVIGFALLAGGLGLFFAPHLRISAHLRRYLPMLAQKAMLRALSAFSLAWLTIGIAFVSLLNAFADDLSPHHTIEMIGVYIGSWLIGFLTIIAPGGIGVRDVLLAIGISTLLNDPLPAVIAILARMMWTISEISLLGLVLLFKPRQAQRKIYQSG